MENGEKFHNVKVSAEMDEEIRMMSFIEGKAISDLLVEALNGYMEKRFELRKRIKDLRREMGLIK